MRTYIQWITLLCELGDHAHKQTTPEQYDYWNEHQKKLRRLLKKRGWFK